MHFSSERLQYCKKKPFFDQKNVPKNGQKQADLLLVFSYSRRFADFSGGEDFTQNGGGGIYTKILNLFTPNYQRLFYVYCVRGFAIVRYLKVRGFTIHLCSKNRQILMVKIISLRNRFYSSAFNRTTQPNIVIFYREKCIFNFSDNKYNIDHERRK